MKRILILLFVLSAFGLDAQLNMNLLSNIDYQQLHGADLNDIWGYVDETGKEYALVGTTKGVSIVDISNPTNPVEVFWEPGLESIWRDLCVWGDFAYITTEAENGLLIIDMSPLPASNVLPTTLYFGDSFPWLLRAHTLYVDEVGRCYVFGSNVGNGGVQIFDVATDPLNPTKIGEFDNWYVHDGFVRGDTMYLAHIYEGFFSLVDISDVTNPVILGTKNTYNNFTHNIWPSDDGQFVYTTDEVSGAFIGAHDISDPTNIIEVDRVKRSENMNGIPHNTHFVGNFIATSYYSEGVTIHDATYPYNLIEVGNFDTYPGQTSGYEGCWGAYPFLPSGNLLATDRAKGLFVLGVNYQQAAYLEGIVTDASTTDPLTGVSVTITGVNNQNLTASSGNYATGSANAGTVQVTYQKIGYYPVTESVNLVQGVITYNDVELVPIPPYSITITVLDAETSEPIPFAFVRFDGTFLTHEGSTNGLGEETLTMYYEEIYEVTAGIWGYQTKCSDLLIDNTTGSITIELEKGYYDDFSFPFGWVSGGTASSGLWVRDIPFGTEENANPPLDDQNDCGKYAFLTGNVENYSFGQDEVNNGEVVLFSPIMDLTTYTDPHVNYSRWFYDKYGPLPVPDDSMRIYLSDGTNSVLIDIVGQDAFNNQWNPRSIRVLDYMPITASMQIKVQTSDSEPNWSIVEAGIDNFYISEYNTTTISQEVQNEISIFPNPFQNGFTIKNAEVSAKYEIYNLNGQQLIEGTISSTNEFVKFASVDAGVYLLKIGNEVKRIVKN